MKLNQMANGKLQMGFSRWVLMTYLRYLIAIISAVTVDSLFDSMPSQWGNKNNNWNWANKLWLVAWGFAIGPSPSAQVATNFDRYMEFIMVKLKSGIATTRCVCVCMALATVEAAPLSLSSP